MLLFSIHLLRFLLTIPSLRKLCVRGLRNTNYYLRRLILAIWKKKYLAGSNFSDSVINSNITLYLIENLVKGLFLASANFTKKWANR